MRILLAHSFYRQMGGEDRYVRRQHELLSEKHTVELLARDNDELSPGQALGSMLYSPAAVTRAGAVMDGFRPDVVHVHNLYPAWGPAVHVAASRRDVPIVMTIHNYRLRCPNGIMFTEGERCRRCLDGTPVNAVLHGCFPTRSQSAVYAATLPWHRHGLRLEDRVRTFVAPSDFVADRLTGWGIAPDRTRVVHHPVHLPADADAAVGTYGLFLGRARAEKGPAALVEALIAAGDPPFRFAGTGPQLDELRTRARDAGLRNLDFLGWVPAAEVEELVRGARYVVVPSRFDEPAGLAALEAMAQGRPLVVSDRGALAELAASDAAVAADPDHPEALAAAIRLYVDDDERCRRAGEAGRALVASRHTEAAHVEALEDVYRSATEARAT